MYSETSETFASLFGGLSNVVCTTVLPKRFRCHFVSRNSCLLEGIFPCSSAGGALSFPAREELQVVFSTSSGYRVLTAGGFLLLPELPCRNNG